MSNNRQVKKRAAPIASNTSNELTSPSLMNKTGYTMIDEPIIVLAILVMTLKELSVPCSTTSDFLS